MSNEAEVSKPEIVRATLEDCRELAENMREEDRWEVFHAAGLQSHEAVMVSMASSEYIYAGKINGKVVCIFGVGEVSPGVGCPWMLATDLLTTVKKTFLRHCRPFVEAMNERYPLLTNKVWVENTTHIRWLKWLGFTFLPHKTVTASGATFQDFVRIKHEH